MDAGCRSPAGHPLLCRLVFRADEPALADHERAARGSPADAGCIGWPGGGTKTACCGRCSRSRRTKTGKKVRPRDLLHPYLRYVLVVGVVLAILQQITGINAVFFYAPIIFEQSGIGTDAAFMQAVLVGLINLVFTVAAMLLIDRVGRKPLLLIGMTGIAITMSLLSWGFGAATYQLDAPGNRRAGVVG